MSQEPVSWYIQLREAHAANWPTADAASTTIITSSIEPPEAILAGVDAKGNPKLQVLRFAAFLDSDPRIIIFLASTNDLALIRNTPGAGEQQLLWRMPSGHRETFTLSGRCYSVTAPLLTHRYGTAPRTIRLPDAAQRDVDEFWEGQRAQAWGRLDARTRARFSWPASGYPKEHVDRAHYAMSLDAADMPTLTGGLTSSIDGAHASAPEGEEARVLRCIHNSAFNNFCLVLFKVARADVLVPDLSGQAVDARRVWECQPQDGSWTCTELNS
jgi:hypothetical protein